MVWASARSAKIFSAVSTTMFSLSATALPDIDWRPRAGGSACPGAALFLRFMMRKSHRPDKRREQGRLHARNTAHGRYYTQRSIGFCRDSIARYGMPARQKAGSKQHEE